MSGLGRHILVEFYECSSEVLNDVTHIENGMVEAAENAGATVINSTFHHFSPFGVSGVVVIQESHLAIHTWPEYEYAAVDLFTCGGEVNPWTSFNFLKKVFDAEHYSAIEINRGQLDLLEKNEDIDLSSMRERVEKHINPPKYTRNVWFTDKDQNVALSIRHTGDKLFKQKSPYQLVEIYDTYAYGKMLSVDHLVMTTERDEFIYHEMITHVPMLMHPNPKKVLVIGGGDGGTVREVVRHDALEQVTMVEIDELVIEASKEHLPNIAAAFDHPKLDLKIGDGIEYVKKAPDKAFDLVIVDGSDPVGPAEGLFTTEFYQNVHRILKDDGILVTQSESPHFNQRTFIEVFKTFNKIFDEKSVFPYLVSIPTYPTGTWSFAYASKGGAHPIKNFDPDEAEQFAEKHGLKYYNKEIHTAAFAMPTFVKDLLKKKEPIQAK